MKSYIIIFTYLVDAILLFSSCSNQKYKQGAFVYEKNCENCHQKKGEGLALLYPPLSNSDYWVKHQNEIPCIIRNGLSDTIYVNRKLYNTSMAGIKDLSDNEIANVINYINNAWYPNIEETTIQEIKDQLKACSIDN